jgi:hypothetical protein
LSKGSDRNFPTPTVDADRIIFVGNIMAEAVLRALPKIEGHDVAGRYGLTSGEYVTVLGDDDGLSERTLEAARWAAAGRMSVLAVSSSGAFPPAAGFPPGPMPLPISASSACSIILRNISA